MPTVLCVCVGCFVWCVCVHWDFSMKNAVSSFLIHIFPPKIFVKTEYHVLWPVVRLMLHQFGEKWSANSTQVKNEGEKDARIDWVSQWTSKKERARERKEVKKRQSLKGNQFTKTIVLQFLLCIFLCFIWNSTLSLRRFQPLVLHKKVCVCVCACILIWFGCDSGGDFLWLCIFVVGCLLCATCLLFALCIGWPWCYIICVRNICKHIDSAIGACNKNKILSSKRAL